MTHSAWRKISPVTRFVSCLGFTAAATFFTLAFIPIYRSQVQPLLIAATILATFSGALLLVGLYGLPLPSAPPGPTREANEAVMPVPDSLREVSAVGREANDSAAG